MGKISVLGSSSSGNCYIIEDEGEKLIVELGVKWKEVLKAVDFKLKDISGIIVTHKHSDHAKYIENALKYGLDVYSCKEVCDIYKGVKLIKEEHRYKIGGFTVQPIKVPHSCECYSFIIRKNNLKILFVTDCSKFKYKVKDCTHILMEANYSYDMLVENALKEENSRSKHVYHMELEDTIKALKANYNTKMQLVLVLHMSDFNSDEELFVNKISEELGFFNVHCAKKGLSLELNESEF